MALVILNILGDAFVYTLMLHLPKVQFRVTNGLISRKCYAKCNININIHLLREIMP